MYENQKILILGAARSGIAVAKLLSKLKNDITLSDVKKIDEKEKSALEKLGVKIIIGPQLGLIDNTFDLIIKTPAIKYTSNIIKKCRRLKLRVENEMEVSYHFLPKDIKIIGVTGSNGKTTTVTIIYELLKRMNQKVVLGGNIGYPLANLVKDIKNGTILVLEISDHQLIDFNDFKTDISVLTNVYPSHLDYHGTYAHYKKSKGKIFNRHSKKDLAIINWENHDSLLVTKNINSQKIYFNNRKNYYTNKEIFIDGKPILNTSDILLKGTHNYENILASLLVVKEFCWNDKIIAEFFKTFNGVEHRLEFVKEIKGVKFYNDSKATNTKATITALKTFAAPLRLILGGEERGQDFNDLTPYMNNVLKIYAIGKTTDRVCEYANNLKIANANCLVLTKALAEIKKDMQKGEIVLLSPASASQDQYAKFEDRGWEFKNVLQSWAEIDII